MKMSALLGSIEKLVASIYPSKEELATKLEGKRKLRIYQGIDPTSTTIHIGHTLPLRLLRSFQDAGHEVILLIGDFTASIGDPSGRDKQRKPLTGKEIKENFTSYENQVKRVLNYEKNPPKVIFNSKWWGSFKLGDFFNLASKFTLAQLSERDLFQERIKKGHPIAISEFLYPLLQGYDSVELSVDIEVGATDQTFNMLVGRQLLRTYKNKDKIVITTPLLEGTDGRKMSKTFGNTIELNLSPNDFYGKVMSIKDSLIEKYFTLLTNLEAKEVKTALVNGNPMIAKKRLAFELVKQYFGESEAETSQREFERVFQKGERTSNVIETKQPISILPKSYASLATIVGATPSVSAAISLADNNGLKFDGQLVSDPRALFVNPNSTTGTIIDVGKRKSIKITWED